MRKRKSNKVNKEPISEMEMNNNDKSAIELTQPIANHKQLKDIKILGRLGGGNVS